VQLLDRDGGPGTRAVNLTHFRKTAVLTKTYLVIGHVYLLDHDDGLCEIYVNKTVGKARK
jgi:hypothetical protein